LNKVGFVVSSSPFPKEVVEIMTSNGVKGGQGQKVKARTFKMPNWPNLNLCFFFAIFLPTLLSIFLSLHSSFNYENKEKNQI
jgi:hypothetical protein